MSHSTNSFWPVICVIWPLLQCFWIYPRLVRALEAAVRGALMLALGSPMQSAILFRSRSLWPPMIIHAVMDWMSGDMAYRAVAEGATAM